MRSTTLFMSFLLLAACGQKETNSPNTKTESENELSEFLLFYEQFHQDSIFQIEHILFPLAGAPSMLNGEKAAGDFRWQREAWLMQGPLDSNGPFKKEFKQIDEALIIEYIVHENGKYAMERRFAKLGDTWNLIYYMDLNSIRQ